jgi:HAMP domain-containing protein
MKTSLPLKLNCVLIPVMLAATAVVLVAVKNAADRTALEETLQTARLLIAAAQATFDYTVEQVKPPLEVKYDFLVQSVSSYAATETIGRMQQQFPDYRYHVAALNPTNKRDLADAWEARTIAALERNGTLNEVTELRTLENGRFAFMAIPIRITNEACLTCHSVPAAAPGTLVDTYGRDHGFGWKLNEVVAAQVVSVPMSVAQQRADALFQRVATMLIAAFAVVLLAVNGALYLVVERRLRRLSRIADRISKGDMDSAAVASRGNDEMSSLERSFERMRVSLSLALAGQAPGADWPLPGATLKRLSARLADALGPMAAVLVERAAAAASSREDFLRRLLQSVPNREEAERLLLQFEFDR